MTTQETKVGSVLKSLLRTEQPVKQVREKTILINVRIPEKMRDDYRRLCFDRKTDMSKEIIKFIRSELDDAQM